MLKTTYQQQKYLPDLKVQATILAFFNNLLKMKTVYFFCFNICNRIMVSNKFKYLHYKIKGCIVK